jgi:regulatory protein
MHVRLHEDSPMPSGPEPYLDALKMLARRDLSEAQVRQRLARHGHDPESIDAAVARLKGERAIDDGRVAEAIARRETVAKRRGRLRVERQIASAGITGATARRAVDEIFGEIDGEALIEAALTRRLRGRTTIQDDAEFHRLCRYLTGQGFETDHVIRTLTARKSRQ